MRDGDWKLIQHYEDGRPELFNLANDIGETNNLAVREPKRAEQMSRSLASWRRQMGAQTNMVNPSFDAAAHRALYVDFESSRFDPATAGGSGRARVLAWRRAMNAAVAKAK